MAGKGALKAILAFGIASTAIHFTHNFVEIEDYPASAIPDWAVQAAIVVSWPLFTWIAIRGYRAYAGRGIAAARPLLVAYGLFALVALGHFTSGSPDIPAVWYATIFTDALAGVLVLGFVAWASRARRAAA